ncbi:MAG: OmpA family protein [Cyclobacteriaceae bacterium]
MKKIFPPLLFILCIILPLSSFAQHLDKLIKQAETTFYDEQFKEAIPKYQAVLLEDASDNNAKYKIELCSLLVRDYRDRSLDTILGYKSTQGRRDKFYYYWLGRILMLQSKFDEAVAAWETFLALKVYKSKVIQQETKAFIEIAKNAQIFYRTPTKYSANIASGVNSSLSELTPAVATDGNILYARRNPATDELQILIAHGTDGEFDRSGDFKGFGDAKETNIDIDVFADGRVFFKNDNKHVYFGNYTNASVSEFDNYEYKLPGGRPKSHFAITINEDRIAFTQLNNNSTLDIFESVKSGDKWGDAAFVDNVNSEFNEDSPFYSEDGQLLYYSSEGFDAVGGLDIMVSTFDGSGWSEPVNLGHPINSVDNELHFSSNTAGTKGYFSSDRVGGEGGYDIYYFEETGIQEPVAAVEPKPAEEVVEVDVPEEEEEEQYTEIDQIGSKFRPGNKAILRNVYFKFNSTSITEDSRDILKDLIDVLNKNSDLKVEIGGHTDNIGSESVNQTLSQKRAQGIVDRLVQEGIEESRLVAKGYGESVPLASNLHEKEGRELNRRIEVKVIE